MFWRNDDNDIEGEMSQNSCLRIKYLCPDMATALALFGLRLVTLVLATVTGKMLLFDMYSSLSHSFHFAYMKH